jgi:hypothetical protein
MASLNSCGVQPVSVTVSVPKSSADSVVIREAATRTRLCTIRQEEEQRHSIILGSKIIRFLFDFLSFSGVVDLVAIADPDPAF